MDLDLDNKTIRTCYECGKLARTRLVPEHPSSGCSDWESVCQVCWDEIMEMRRLANKHIYAGHLVMEWHEIQKSTSS